MPAFPIIKIKTLSQAFSHFQAVFECVQVEIMILHGPPKAFNEDVVQESTSAIHTDFDAVGFQNICESLACELTTLIGIEYIRAAVLCDRLLKGRYAEIRVKCV